MKLDGWFKIKFCNFEFFVGQQMFSKCAFFFKGTSGGIVVLLSSLASFVSSTRLAWSRIGAIDSPDQSRQGFEQYHTCIRSP